MAGCCSAPTSSRTRDVIEAAYNDSAGVTAQFNLNVLHVVNRELGADFDVDAFEHVAFFDREREWIEMRLRAREAQHVHVAALDLDVDFAAREELRTEISAKFTLERLRGDLAAAGLELVEVFTDPDEGCSPCRSRGWGETDSGNSTSTADTCS